MPWVAQARSCRRAFFAISGGAGRLTLLLGLLLVASACGPRPAANPTALPRLAYLSPGARETARSVTDLFVAGLTDLGYVEGQNIEVDYWFLDDVGKPLPEVASELVQGNPDVIVAIGTARVEAVKQATNRIPIVMAQVVDAVEAGLVANLARPGGNVTGAGTVSAELSAKRLEILKQTVPNLSRVAILATLQWTTPNSPIELQWRGVQRAATDLGVELRLVEIPGQSRNPETIAAVKQAIEDTASEGAQAIYPLSDALFDALRPEIAATALRLGLPSIYRRADFVELGGLMSYGSNTADEFRRVANYVDKLVKGAKPEDLPVSLPTRFDLAINLKTAAALGIAAPDLVLAQATQLIS